MFFYRLSISNCLFLKYIHNIFNAYSHSAALGKPCCRGHTHTKIITYYTKITREINVGNTNISSCSGILPGTSAIGNYPRNTIGLSILYQILYLIIAVKLIIRIIYFSVGNLYIQ